ncbi:MAG: hydroxysqualene dehydroxylase HpnE [Alphaproteobacteria bacterium]
MAQGGTVHIVGAGVAGLAAALKLSGGSRRVVLHEAAGQAGGRCRSYFDDLLGCEIDNGNHLLLSGNRAAMEYLETIGARDTLTCIAPAQIPFVDLADGARWTLRPNAGPLPWWIFARNRRVPGSSSLNYLGGIKLAFAARDATIEQVLKRDPGFFRRFWEPIAVSALNTGAHEAAAKLFLPVLVETLAKGESESRPCMARDGLAKSFVDPALTYLAAKGVTLEFNDRLRAIEQQPDRAAALAFAGDTVTLGATDRVVLAVPSWVAADLMPGLTVPREHRPIVNAHLKTATPLRLPGGMPLIGIVGGLAQWVFVREHIASVTISAAEAEVDQPPETLGPKIWRDVCRAAGIAELPLPPYRIVKEKRATFAQTPAEIARRPGTKTHLNNLVLAGDWTDTKLPATIEGAIRSGFAAAKAVAAA